MHENKTPTEAEYKQKLATEISASAYTTFCGDVARERQRQIRKFGLQHVPVCNAPPGDTAAWYGLVSTDELRTAVEDQMSRKEEDILAILLEEVGEARDAARTYQADPTHANAQALKAELVQVATVCLKGIEQVDYDQVMRFLDAAQAARTA